MRDPNGQDRATPANERTRLAGKCISPRRQAHHPSPVYREIPEPEKTRGKVHFAPANVHHPSKNNRETPETCDMEDMEEKTANPLETSSEDKAAMRKLAQTSFTFASPTPITEGHLEASIAMFLAEMRDSKLQMVALNKSMQQMQNKIDELQAENAALRKQLTNRTAKRQKVQLRFMEEDEGDKQQTATPAQTAAANTGVKTRLTAKTQEKPAKSSTPPAPTEAKTSVKKPPEETSNGGNLEEVMETENLPEEDKTAVGTTEKTPEVHEDDESTPPEDSKMETVEKQEESRKRKLSETAVSEASEDEDEPLALPTPKQKTGMPSDREAKTLGTKALDSSTKVCTIVLRDPKEYMGLTAAMQARGIAISKAKITDVGVRLYPKTVGDYRSTIRLLHEKNLAYHTYTLEEERGLKLVLKGLRPEIASPAEVGAFIRDELKIPIRGVSRMLSRKDQKPLPMMLCEFPREERDRAYAITRVLGLTVSAEALKPRGEVGQCYNCQLYGHCQSRCTAKPVCVKCGGPHRPKQCRLKESEKCRCANCGGAHPANYKGCKKHPENKKKEAEKRKTNSKPITKPGKAQTGVSYASAASGGKNEGGKPQTWGSYAKAAKGSKPEAGKKPEKPAHQEPDNSPPTKTQPLDQVMVIAEILRNVDLSALQQALSALAQAPARPRTSSGRE